MNQTTQPADILRHDVANDVLYARLPDRRVVQSLPLEDDDFVILNVDAGGDVVGVQLIEAREMTPGRWREFFRSSVPAPLFDAIDRWLATRAFAH